MNTDNNEITKPRRIENLINEIVTQSIWITRQQVACVSFDWHGSSQTFFIEGSVTGEENDYVLRPRPIDTRNPDAEEQLKELKIQLQKLIDESCKATA